MYAITKIEKVTINEDGTNTWMICDEANMMTHIKRPYNETIGVVASLVESAGVPVQYLARALSV